MKNSQISFAFALLSAAFFGCQKEATLPGYIPGNPQSSLQAEIKFFIGEKSYELKSVQRSSDITNAGCGFGCGDSYAKDFSDDWTTYSAGNWIVVTRQDDTEKPAFRLSLLGAIDLNASSLPAHVANARITLNDFNGALIQPTDDPAYQSGALSFEGSQDAVQLTISSRNGNVVEGSFGGVLKMLNGSAVEIRDGTFKAQLRGL
jgi:hypothetical protein